MLGWIERVVPQPPVSSPVPVVVVKDPKAEESPFGARARLARHRQQPGGSPGNAAEGPDKEDSDGTEDPVSTTESAGRGVLTWLSEGLGKVLPQPAPSCVPLQEPVQAGQSFEASIEIPDVTEVQSIQEEEEEEDGLLEMLGPDEEEGNVSELQSSSDNNDPEKNGGKKVFSWLMEGFGKMVPQPESVKKNEERTAKENAAAERANSAGSHRGTPVAGSSPDSPPSAAGAQHRVSSDSQSGLSVSLFPRSLGGDGGGGSIVGWFVQGLEKVMPQPVSKAKQESVEAEGLGPGQDRSKGA